MVQYRFARNSEDVIVDANELASGDHFELEAFTCVSCERRLVAKVHGAIRQPHFAHHPGSDCQPETYLHKLGKQVFADEFLASLKAGEPFEIVVQHPKICRRFEEHLNSPCIMSGTEEKTYDLTNYYNEVRLEKPDGEFIPDLLLFHRKYPDRKLYIEIAVTHFLSDKKSRSCEKIIEIPISNEEDLNKIRSRRLTAKEARFLNFTTPSELPNDADCKCATKRAFGFMVFRSGKCFIEDSTLSDVASKSRPNQDLIEYFRVVVADEERYRPQSASFVFREAVEHAAEEGFPIKNCYLCEFQGDNFVKGQKTPIYCKRFKKKCKSDAAAACNAYKRK